MVKAWDRRIWLFVVALIIGVVVQSVSGETFLGADARGEHLSDEAVVTGISNSTVQEGHVGEGEEVHTDPFAFILLELGLIIGVAMVGRWLADRTNQPAVLGELLFGVLLGNIGYWLGSPLFTVIMNLGTVSPLFGQVWNSEGTVTEAARSLFSATELAGDGIGTQLVEIMTGSSAPTVVVMAFALWIFSNLGVILLLFMVGLESSVEDMLKVGPRALSVAILGVVTPFFLGIAVTYWLLPNASLAVHLFLAATLCATSVGITARVFKDLDRVQTAEAQVIIGAAVIDDILGLIILAVVMGVIVTGEIVVLEVLRIAGLSFLFLGAVVLLGERFVRFMIPFVTALDRHHSKLLFPISLAFVMAWVASQIQLATIVGAFAAGLILNNEAFTRESAESLTMEEVIAPLEKIFAPIFFVLMGMQVNLATFLDLSTLWLALAFIAVAIIGKLVSGLPAGRGMDRLSVGIGMVPRGEVGLIFASVGKGLGVVGDSIFSAIVIMVIVTTLITPIALKWSLFRLPRPEPIAREPV